MEKKTVLTFIAGAAVMSTIDYLAFATFRKDMIRKNLINRHLVNLSLALVNVTEEKCPDIWLDERLRTAMDNYRFDQITGAL